MSSTTHLVSAEQLIKIASDQHRYELIKGELLTMSPPGGEHGKVAMNLSAPLATHIKRYDLGISFIAETGFKLESNPDTVLAPDFAFIAKNRIDEVTKGYVEIAPDLVVEVISPDERKARVERKTLQWLSFGVRSVWLVRPDNGTIETISLNGKRRLFERSAVLSDEVVPGFELRLSEIFG